MVSSCFLGEPGRSAFYSFSRLPKIAVPTRTRVAPSSTAASKSWLIPIDRCSKAPDGMPAVTSRSRRALSLANLVGLQMPDEVPAGAGEIGGRGDLLFRLLHLVLAEVPLSRLPRRADMIGAERLRYGDQGDGRRVAAGPSGCCLDPRPDLGVVVSDGLFGGQRQEGPSTIRRALRIVDVKLVVTS